MSGDGLTYHGVQPGCLDGSQISEGHFSWSQVTKKFLQIVNVKVKFNIKGTLTSLWAFSRAMSMLAAIWSHSYYAYSHNCR